MSELTQQYICQKCKIHPFCHPVGFRSSELENTFKENEATKIYHKGDILFSPAARLDNLIVITSGSVKTTYYTAKNIEQIIGFHFPYEIIGLDALSQDGDSPIIATALETTAICEISFEHLLQLATKDTALQKKLLKLATHSYSPYNLNLNNTANQRLALFILNLSDNLEQRGLSKTYISLSMPRHDIANYLGLTIETVSRLLTHMQKNKLISIEKRLIKIIEIEKLKEIATT